MPLHIRSAAVLGAGAMGAQLAAHLSNAGVQVRLYDRSSEIARSGLERARRLKPDPFFTAAGPSLITCGSLDDLTGIGNVDWIIEAIVEDLDVKRALFARIDIDEMRAPHAVVSSNTSSLSLSSLAQGRSDGFRRHFLGTHFFNPPRYLHLVEAIATADTDATVLAGICDFLDRRLGKGVVPATDAPAFIANHLGTYGIIRLLHAAASGRWTIEEIDAITGPAIGRPKSATFRTIDLAGLDILAHVAADLEARLPDPSARAQFALPPFVARMLDRGLLGDKTQQGFYRKVKRADGTTILTLDLDTLEYREPRAMDLPALESVKRLANPGDRIRMLLEDDGRVGDLLRETLLPLLTYAAVVWPNMANSIDDVDRAMRWGFGWEIGPFETMDAIGSAAGAGVAARRPGPLAPAHPDFNVLVSARAAGGVLRSQPGASLIDLGDDVLGLEFHSKMNTLGPDAIEMIHDGVREAESNFAALVIGTDGPLFSAGADLLLVAKAAQAQRWTEIDEMVRAFQSATMAMKLAAVPVIVAPAGLALGGGCEIVLHADRVQASAETYIGLVEVGVGLIPAGGGTKEMLLRAIDGTAAKTERARAVQRLFETIGFGKTSTSAADARALGYLRDVDGISMNRDRIVSDAKALGLERARSGHVPRTPRTAVPVGGADAYAVLSLGVHLARRAERISDHDALVGRKLAWILSGGNPPHAAMVSESYLLDLEREAFLSLCGEAKTLDRISYTLKTGKSLRN